MNEFFSLVDVKDFTAKLDNMDCISRRLLEENLDKEDTYSLLKMMDYTTRAAAMFSHIISQYLQGEIVTSDPQHYIKSKINGAYAFYERLEKKYPIENN